MMLWRGHPVIGFGDAECPTNPPPPAGYVVWSGPVPPSLEQWVFALLRDIAVPPYGQQWTAQSDGVAIVARKDHHAWTYRTNADGSTTLVTGICIPGITLYRPSTGAAGEVVDPSTAQPDPELAVFSPLRPTARTNWGLVAAGGAAIVTTVGLFFWGMHAAARQ